MDFNRLVQIDLSYEGSSVLVDFNQTKIVQGAKRTKRIASESLFRTPHCGGSRHEQGALRGGLRGGGTELELALIELIDDLAHGCLIWIGRSP